MFSNQRKLCGMKKFSHGEVKTMAKYGPSGLYYSPGGSSRNGFSLYVIRNRATVQYFSAEIRSSMYTLEKGR